MISCKRLKSDFNIENERIVPYFLLNCDFFVPGYTNRLNQKKYMDREVEFVRTIKENEGVIFKITTIYTDNREDQRDLYQDIVYQLWKSFDAFRGEAKFSTWMYRIALNTALSRIKKNKRKGHALPIEQVVLTQTELYDTVFEERIKTLYEQIHQLNVLEKGLMLLLLEGKSYSEIAEITGLTPSNVGTRISRIKTKLKSKIINK